MATETPVMSRDQVMEQVARHDNIRARVVEGDFRVLPTDSGLGIRPAPRAHTLEASPDGVLAMLARAGINQTLAGRLDAKTMAEAATQALQAQGAMGLMVKDAEVVDVAPPGRYREVVSTRVIDAVEKGMGQAEFLRLLEMPHHSLRLECLGMEERPVRGPGHAQANDLLRAGSVVEWSPIGLAEPTVEAFTVRLICTNGLVATDVLRKYEFGGAGDNGNGSIYPWFRNSARDAYGAIGPIVARYEALAQEAIAPGDRASILEALIKDAKMARNDADAVRAKALEEPPENAWEMTNLMTWATSHVIEDPVRVVRAQRTAQIFSSEDSHARVCPTCSHRR